MGLKLRGWLKVGLICSFVSAKFAVGVVTAAEYSSIRVPGGSVSRLETAAKWQEDGLHLLSFEDAPYVYSEGHEVRGMVVRFVKQLMERANVPYQISILPPKRAVLLTLNNPRTCVFPIERSQEREVQLSWISPISISRHAFFSHPDELSPPVRVLNDSQGLRIGSAFGSAISDYLASLGLRVDAASDNLGNLTKLLAHRIDLWAADERTAKFISRRERIALGEPELVFFTTLRAIGCHLDVPTQLVSLLSNTLIEMYQDGTIQEIEAAFSRGELE